MSTGRSRRIPEIDGLRGIALTLVVFFHLFGQGRVSGGVDVFLFVSGVVLTMSLMNDVSQGRQYRLGARWTRTFGRLALPSAIVLLVVAIMSITILPPWQRTQTLSEVVATGLYMENWQLIWSQLSYEAAGPATSPLQHFWSLSIQGQFFLTVPLVVACVFAARRFLRRPGAILIAISLIGTIGSFGYAVQAQAVNPEAAYFDTFARFWEFGLGILVAGAISLGWRIPQALTPSLGWLGLFAILASGFIIDGSSAYPGPAALVPVGGAILVVFAASATSGARSLSTVLRSRPLTALNRYSYALYLWHWPILIAYLALRDRQGGQVGWKGALAILIVSAVLAALTNFLVERPAQTWFATGVSKKTIAIVLAAILIVPAGSTAAIATQRVVESPTIAGDCSGAAALDPERPECTATFDPSVPLKPSLAELSSDDDNRGECWAGWDSNDVNVCSLGPTEKYERHLLAVGDSHNNTLIGAYERIADEYNWRIDVVGRASCHWTSAYRFQRNDLASELCGDWNAAIDDLVATTDLDAIIVTNSSSAGYRAWGAKSEAEERRDGYITSWQKRADLATPIIAIRDNPLFPSDEMSCLEDQEGIAAGTCDFPRGDVLHDDGLSEAVDLDPHALHVDLTDYMCSDETCSLVVGGVVVARSDGIHLSATFARTLAPYLGREIAVALNS